MFAFSAARVAPRLRSSRLPSIPPLPSCVHCYTRSITRPMSVPVRYASWLSWGGAKPTPVPTTTTTETTTLITDPTSTSTHDASIALIENTVEQQQTLTSLTTDPLVTEAIITSTNSFVLKVWDAFNAVHELSGLSWTWSIVATVVAFKIITFPVAVIQQRNAARLQLANPELKRLQAQYAELRALGEVTQADSIAFAAEMRAIHARNGVKLSRNMILPIVQAPFYMGSFFALKHNIAPGMHDQGLLWFPDLTIPDPMYILPAAVGITTWASIELVSDTGMQPEQMQTFKWVFRGLSVFTVIFCSTLPTACLMYWITNTSWSLIQGVLFRMSWFKKIFGITNVKEEVAARTAQGYYNKPSIFGTRGVPNAPPSFKPSTNINKYTPTVKSTPTMKSFKSSPTLMERLKQVNIQVDERIAELKKLKEEEEYKQEQAKLAKINKRK